MCPWPKHACYYCQFLMEPIGMNDHVLTTESETKTLVNSDFLDTDTESSAVEFGENIKI